MLYQPVNFTGSPLIKLWDIGWYAHSGLDVRSRLLFKLNLILLLLDLRKERKNLGVGCKLLCGSWNKKTFKSSFLQTFELTDSCAAAEMKNIQKEDF